MKPIPSSEQGDLHAIQRPDAALQTLEAFKRLEIIDGSVIFQICVEVCLLEGTDDFSVTIRYRAIFAPSSLFLECYFGAAYFLPSEEISSSWEKIRPVILTQFVI